MGSTCVYTCLDAPQAHLLNHLLESEGIPCIIVGEALAHMAGGIPLSNSRPTLHVPEAFAERARVVLATFEDQQRAPAPPGTFWTCPECREAIEGQFDTCWKCEFERPPESSSPAHQDPAASLMRPDLQCVKCGYSLRGLEMFKRCPECGWAIVMTLMHGMERADFDQDYEPILRPFKEAAQRVDRSVWAIILVVWACISAHDDDASIPGADGILTALRDQALRYFGEPREALAYLHGWRIHQGGDVADIIEASVAAGLLGVDKMPVAQLRNAGAIDRHFAGTPLTASPSRSVKRARVFLILVIIVMAISAMTMIIYPWVHDLWW